MGYYLHIFTMLAIIAGFIAAALSFTQSPLAAIVLRIVIACIAVAAFCAIGFGLVFIIGFGRAFGNSPTLADFGVLIPMVAALAYFAFAFFSCFAFIPLQTQWRWGFIMHFVVAPLILICLLIFYQYHAAKYLVTSYAIMSLCYALLWYRMYAVRARETIT